MKNVKVTKALAVGLCAVVLAPSLVSAKEFKDVTKNGPYRWAYSYIDDLSDRGIINGYPNGEFKPDNPVNFEETIELIKGVLAPSSSQIAAARLKYNAVLEETKVADWAKDAMAIAIDNGIFTEATLREAAKEGFLTSSNKNVVPDRNTIAVYFARALKLSSTGDESYLRHEDKSEIPSSTRGYLANLVKAGIFSSTGSDGKFEGKRSIRRSEMAKITKLSYDYMKSETNKVVSTSTITGKVILATGINNADTIIVQLANNSTISVKVNASTKITSNNTTLKFSDLQVNQEVKVTYQKVNEDNIATAVEVTNLSKNLVGYVTARAQDGFTAKYVENTSSVDTTLQNQINTTTVGTFTLDTNVKIYSLGTETVAANLSIDDMVEFKTNANGKISEAFVYPVNGRVYGMVTRISNTGSNSREFITLRLADGKEYTFYGNNIGNNPFNYYSMFNNVRVGQYVNLNTKYKTVSSIGEYNNSNIKNGRVTYASNSQYQNINITLATGTNENLYLYLDSNTEIRENGIRRAQITTNDLQNKEVRVALNGNYVTQIDILTSGSNFNARARVESITNDNTFGQLTTTYVIRISYSDNSFIASGSAYRLTLNTNGYFIPYSIGDELQITGTSSQYGEIGSISNIYNITRGTGNFNTNDVNRIDRY